MQIIRLDLLSLLRQYRCVQFSSAITNLRKGLAFETITQEIYYFCPMESQRQKKIASVLQRDLVEVLQGAAREGGMQGVIISVTKVNVTVILSIAKGILEYFSDYNRRRAY